MERIHRKAGAQSRDKYQSRDSTCLREGCGEPRRRGMPWCGLHRPAGWHTGSHRDPSLRYKAYQRRAVNLRLPFALTFREFVELILAPCKYCLGTDYDAQVGIDRVIWTQGYTLDNCAPCCEICNRMKGRLEPEAFVLKARRIVEVADMRAKQ